MSSHNFLDCNRRAPPTTARRWWTLATVALAQLMVVLDSTVVNIALPSAQADLGFSDGRPPVDRHRLLARLRQPAAARRPPLRPHRPQAHLHHRPRRLRRRVRARRRGRHLRAARRRPRAAGRVRRAARPDRARRADDDLHHPEGARPRVRRLRRDRRCRRCDRPAARRLPHRELQTGAGTSTSTSSSP